MGFVNFFEAHNWLASTNLLLSLVDTKGNFDPDLSNLLTYSQNKWLNFCRWTKKTRNVFDACYVLRSQNIKEEVLHLI